jgi:hypothetical protein
MSKGNKNIADKLPKPACGRTTLIIGRDITRFLLPSKLKEKKRAGHSRLIIERERERAARQRWNEQYNNIFPSIHHINFILPSEQLKCHIFTSSFSEKIKCELNTYQDKIQEF